MLRGGDHFPFTPIHPPTSLLRSRTHSSPMICLDTIVAPLRKRQPAEYFTL
jgi:hypothetical protein